MNRRTVNEELLNFINSCPTAFHTAENLCSILGKEGFEQLSEGVEWSLRPGGCYYTVRNASSVIAFRIPEQPFRGFLMTASHSDSPALKIKETSTAANGAYTALNIERYGGMIYSTWMDKPLGAAGRVLIEQDGKIVSRTVDLHRNVACIPNVAIHLNRSVNEGAALNPAVDLQPVIGGKDTDFDAWVAEAAGCDKKDILSKDLMLYPRTPGIQWGPEGEWISSPRLDDLQCAWTCLQGFLSSDSGSSASVYCCFDNEEVGSGTRQGADSDFLRSVLERICACEGIGAPGYFTAMENSFLISADNAHAVHPNHPELHDKNDRPILNGGIVVKYNAAQRYTTDSVSAAVFRSICKKADVPVQTYANRADLPGGSTLGNISSSHVAVRSVDIGLPQLAMHSAWETAGAEDTLYMIRAIAAYYSSSYRITPEGIEL